MSWLARLEVNTETILAEGIYDSYAWHKRLWECFANTSHAKRDFLARIDHLEGAFRLWILAKRKPVRPQWCSPNGFALKEIAASFLTHRYYAFDLRANPTKCIVQRGLNGETLLHPNGKRKHGKRAPIVKPGELRGWIDRKAIAGGFRIVEDKPLEIGRMVENHFCKKNKENSEEQAAYHGGVQFRGTLEVIDPVGFIETYQSGVGSAKSFGFGLLLLAPINL